MARLVVFAALFLALRAGQASATLMRPLRRALALAAFSGTLSASPVFALTSSETQLIDLFHRATPSVTYIDTFTKQYDLFSMNVFEIPAGAGSGFVWDTAGHVVTNYHVIRNAGSARVTVTSADGRAQTTVKATVVGVDPDKDVAVLAIDPAAVGQGQLKPLAVGTSKDLKVGQTTLAIGNPFGLDHTLTTGIISGLGREVRSPSNRPITNVIQTDAAINPGNSGGPLLDSAGRLIGMNTAIYSTSGASSGIGFAIPVDTLTQEVNTLIRDGRIVRPVMGISYMESGLAKSIGITQGILVLEVREGSPAQAAGLRSTSRAPPPPDTGAGASGSPQQPPRGGFLLGDIIIGIDDDAIATESDLFKALEKHRVGDEVNLRVLRSADAITATTAPNDNSRFTETTLRLTLSAPEDVMLNQR